MNIHSQASTSIVRTIPLWISDHEVRAIFAKTRCWHQVSNGYSVQEANAVFIREQRTREGTLGFVYRNPIDGQNWLWVISKKTRKPWAMAKVS